jgi:diamine N-acetyltransferase
MMLAEEAAVFSSEGIKPIAATARLVGNGVALTPLSEDLIEQLREWRCRDDIRRWFIDTRLITPEQQRTWFAGYLKREDDVTFIIRRLPEDRPVGAIALYNIDRQRRRAEYGRLLIGEPSARGTGLAEDASGVMIDWAFRQLGIADIYLWVRQDNVRAATLYRRMGFVEATPETAQADCLYMVLRHEAA